MTALLTPIECRVIGALIEKEITTPDHYPLSLNSLTVACNQKSNRDPVMNLSESDVQTLVDALQQKRLIMESSGFGSRVSKIQHRFCNTEFSDRQFSSAQLAVVCELLLRGPQTPGELRSRCQRLHPFTEVSQIDTVLESLMQCSSGPSVIRLEREPGRREHRFAHLFSGKPEGGCVSMPDIDGSFAIGTDRLASLEQAVASLSAEISRIKAAIGLDD